MTRHMAGIVALCVGFGVSINVHRLAVTPKLVTYYKRHPVQAGLSLPFREYLQKPQGVRVLTKLWRICGFLWLVGGLCLLLVPGRHGDVGSSFSEADATPLSFIVVQVCALSLFGIGALTRAYMEMLIGRSPLTRGLRGRNTELTYNRLRSDQGVPLWPLIVTLVCMPLGIVIALGAIIWENQATGK